jgi:hypothetical protein
VRNMAKIKETVVAAACGIKGDDILYLTIHTL